MTINMRTWRKYVITQTQIRTGSDTALFAVLLLIKNLNSEQ